jgi:hypothetical protein
MPKKSASYTQRKFDKEDLKLGEEDNENEKSSKDDPSKEGSSVPDPKDNSVEEVEEDFESSEEPIEEKVAFPIYWKQILKIGELSNSLMDQMNELMIINLSDEVRELIEFKKAGFILTAKPSEIDELHYSI